MWFRGCKEESETSLDCKNKKSRCMCRYINVEVRKDGKDSFRNRGLEGIYL